MGKVITLVLAALLAVFVFALLGESFPEGSAFRGVADGIRGFGRSVGDVFGGGYGKLPQG